MKNIFFGLLVIGLIIGIMFLTFQIIYIPGRGDDNNFPPHSYFSFDNENGYGLLNFNKPVSGYIILDKQSYAISPNNEKFSITSKDHEYNDYIRIYLKDSNGKNKYSLERGKWRFVIFYKTINDNEIKKDEHYIIMQRGYLYIPIIDGPPN